MPKTTCITCGNVYDWPWEDAFDKFGYSDGDGMVMTEAVANALRRAGYTVDTVKWGLHNTIIRSITKHGIEQIPDTAEIGYDDPRLYLPKDLVHLLDNRLDELLEAVS